MTGELAGQVLAILDDRTITPTEQLRRIRKLVTPQPECRPVDLDEKGWPILPPGSGVVELPDSPPDDGPYDPRD